MISNPGLPLNGPSATPARGPMSRFGDLAKELFAHRLFPAIAALLGMALGLSALRAGFHLDDYFHRAVLLRTPSYRGFTPEPNEMFRFVGGDPVMTLKRIEQGCFPWWTDPQIKLAFMHTIPTLTHRLDYWLWPNSPAFMHAQSVAWLGLAIAGAGMLYRRLLGPAWIAGLAVLLFALDDSHAQLIGWLANRNALIAATFCILALVAHDRARRDGKRLAKFLAPALFAAALFSKEEGVSLLAYLFAYAIFIDTSGRQRGLRSIVPYVLVLITWYWLRGHWGYGVAHIGLYVDPLGRPLRFLKAIVERLPLLLLGLWTPIPSSASFLALPAGRSAFWRFAVASLILPAFVVLTLTSRDRRARFLATGMLLSLIPVCGTEPGNRLLIAPSVGASGLIALFIGFAIEKPRTGAAIRLRRSCVAATAWILAITHLGVAPCLLAYLAENPMGPPSVMKRFYVDVPLDPSIQKKTLVLINPPMPMFAGYVPMRRESAGLPAPRRTRVLAPGLQPIRIRRIDDRTLVIRPDHGYLSAVIETFFRGEEWPMRVGQKVALEGMTVTVTEITSDGRPAEASFRFDLPLEDPSFSWLLYEHESFELFKPPAIGTEERVGGG